MGPAPTFDVKIDVAQLSDPGRDPNKQINEDSCGYAQTRFGHLCVLCDGMGGHYGGQEASRRAITTIFEQIDQAAPTATPAQALKYAIEVAARRVYELGGPPDNKVRPGSTVVAMLVHDDGLDVAHVGDSRAYVIRSGQIYPLTRDHSMVQAMIDAGFITEEQGIGHPDANKITRALGMKPEVDVELRPEPMELFAGDILLTASDGLTDLALAKDILSATRQALASGGIEHTCQQLVRMANDRGGHDNITVQVVRVLSTGQRRTRTGSTLSGEPIPTAPTAASPAATLDQKPLPAGMPSPHLASTQDMAPMSVMPQSYPHGAAVAGAPATGATLQDASGPTSVDRPRARQETLNMQSAATAFDGTSMQVAAAGPASTRGADGGGQGLHLPPVPPLMGHGLAQSLEPPKAMADYRLDGPSGLPLPPQSSRQVEAHGGAPAVHVGGHPMGHVGMAAGARHVQPTAAMTPPTPPASAQGWSQPPSSWAGTAQQPGAPQQAAHPPATWHAPGGTAPAPGRGLAITANDLGPSPAAAPLDSPTRTGGNVLFLALAISFVLAVAVLAIVWIFVLNS